MTQLIGQQLGRYLVQEEIGRGGMARVYRAFDTSLQRTVALKVLAPHLALDPEFSRRFEREAVTVANLRHPNIVTVYDVGESNGLRYIAMEYVRGRTLHAIIHERGALGLAIAISIVTPVAAALDHAHAQGAVHRDIKPHNILIDIEGRVLLTDFGIAQAPEGSGERLTRTGMFMGTPEYISPEQASAQRVDGRSDLYSLAVATYEMITGMVPFSGATPQLIIAHVQSLPPPPSSIDPQQPRELDLVLARALAKRSEQRFGSGAAFVEALRIVARRNGVTPASQQEIADLALPRAMPPWTPPRPSVTETQASHSPGNGQGRPTTTPDADRIHNAVRPHEARLSQPPATAAPPAPSRRAPEQPGMRWRVVGPLGAGVVIIALLAALFAAGTFSGSGQAQPALPQATLLPTSSPPPAATWTPVPSPTFTATPLPTDTPTPEPPTPEPTTPVPPTQVPIFIPPPPPPPVITPEPPSVTPEPPSVTPEPPSVTPEPPTATPTDATPSATSTPEISPGATPTSESLTPTSTPEPASIEPPSPTPDATPAMPSETPTPTAEPPSATPNP